MYKFGDVLILNFPFAEGNGSKRRPVVVIKDTQDGDVLVAKLTSRSYSSVFDVSLAGWKAANLTAPSVARMHKIQTVSVQLIFGHIGRLSAVDLLSTKTALQSLLSNS